MSESLWVFKWCWSAASAKTSGKKKKNLGLLAARGCKVSCFNFCEAWTKPTSLFFPAISAVICSSFCLQRCFVAPCQAGKSEERAIKNMIAAKLGEAQIAPLLLKVFLEAGTYSCLSEIPHLFSQAVLAHTNFKSSQRCNLLSHLVDCSPLAGDGLVWFADNGNINSLFSQTFSAHVKGSSYNQF